MIAYQFIAHDRVGMTLTGVVDGIGEWSGTDWQRDEAEYFKAYFLEHEVLPHVTEDFAPYED